jgi:hypothetical protein
MIDLDLGFAFWAIYKDGSGQTASSQNSAAHAP